MVLCECVVGHDGTNAVFDKQQAINSKPLFSLVRMASHKIIKIAGAQPSDEFELTVAQALVDLENNVPELKKELRPLQITAAKEV